MSIVHTDDDTLLQEGQAAASGAALAGGVWKSPLTPTDGQVAALKDMQSYQVLKTYIKEQAINVRGCLSHHVRCAHLPDDYHLKKCGLDDTPLRIHEEGMVAIKLYIPNAFQAGDGQFIDYTSGPHRNKLQAQAEACLEILALLLAVAPRNVITTVNQWRDGEKVVRQADAVCNERRAALHLQLSPEQPLAPLAPSRRSRNYQPPNSDAEAAQRETDVLALFATLQARKYEYVPTSIGLQLERLLPPGGLRPFFRRHPDMFRIEQERPLHWSKLARPQVHTPTPGASSRSQTLPGGDHGHNGDGQPLAAATTTTPTTATRNGPTHHGDRNQNEHHHNKANDDNRGAALASPLPVHGDRASASVSSYSPTLGGSTCVDTDARGDHSHNKLGQTQGRDYSKEAKERRAQERKLLMARSGLSRQGRSLSTDDERADAASGA